MFWAHLAQPVYDHHLKKIITPKQVDQSISHLVPMSLCFIGYYILTALQSIQGLGFILSSSPTHKREILESVHYKVKEYLSATTWANHYFHSILLTLLEMLYVVNIFTSLNSVSCYVNKGFNSSKVLSSPICCCCWLFTNPPTIFAFSTYSH